MKQDTKFKPGVSGNETTKWGPGQSGNPIGKSKGRARFEEAFNEALITQGSAEEAAQLLWQAARGKEPWAIQEVCRRFAPQTQSLQLVQEVHNDEFDYTKGGRINKLDKSRDFGYCKVDDQVQSPYSGRESLAESSGYAQ